MAIVPNLPLQLQSEQFKQLTNIHQHAEQFLEHFIDLVTLTYETAPLREKRDGRDDLYLLETDRSKDVDMRIRERALERAIWNIDPQPTVFGDWLLRFCCRAIQAYQVPLKNTENDVGWGKVDLVGVSPQWTPVVIELKQEVGDNPLRMIAEGLSYAIALRRAWNAGHLKECWSKVMKARYGQDSPETHGQMSIIGMAPKEYWQRAVLGPQALVPSKTWPILKSIIRRCEEAGYSFRFAEFEVVESDAQTPIPTVQNMRLVELPS